MQKLIAAVIASFSAFGATPKQNAVPAFFAANRGQAPPSVRFMMKEPWGTAYFSHGQILFRLGEATVRMRFEGANRHQRLQGREQLPGSANFLTGAEKNWRVGVPMYGAVVYHDLYKGVEVVYRGDGRTLKSEFVVAPQTNPSRIRITYFGAEGLRISDDGSLMIRTNGQELREEAPFIFQEADGKQMRVNGGYALRGGTVGFIVGEYDPSRPLIIDPALSYSTLLGGSSSDTATSLAVDALGSAYVAGFTSSSDLPLASPVQRFNGGGNDVFVAKLSASGSGLVYCTYLGGSGDDRAYGIAVDTAGSAYVTGSTTSRNFPVRNALQSSLTGGRNAFVLKLNASGDNLVFSFRCRVRDRRRCCRECIRRRRHNIHELSGEWISKDQSREYGCFRRKVQRERKQPAVQHLSRRQQ